MHETSAATTPFGVLRPAQVRGANTTAVLRLLLAAGPLSRAEIAQRLGLTHGPVTRITAQLVAAGWVHELERVGSGEPGRPRVPVALSPAAGHVVGLHVGAYEVTAGVVDLTGEVHEYVRVAHDTTPAGTVDIVVDAVRTLSGPVGSPLRGIGLITSGWVEPRTGHVHHQPLLGWDDVPLRALVQQAVGAPVVMEQTARALATADLVHDLVGGTRDFLHVFIGNALEAALVVDGSLRTAADGFGGDLSRWSVGGGRAGRGPLTTAGELVCDFGLLARAQARGVPLHHGAHLDDLLALREDPTHGRAVRAVLRDGAATLGRLLAEVSDLLGPELIVVTSHLGVFDADFDVVEGSLLTASGGRHTPPVRRSRSAGHPTISPAAAVALEQVMAEALTS